MQSKKVTYLILFLTATVIFQFDIGLHVINPSYIDWLLVPYHDWGQHYLGWAFYRNEPWTFPLGFIQNFHYPTGTNISMTDSIPLLALVFKPFTHYLPEKFQYFGLFMYSSYLLLTYFTFKIFEYYKTNQWISFLGVILVVANPVMMYRFFHPALTAQWVIVASLFFYIQKSEKQTASSINRKQYLLILITALIHPYLAVVVAGFNFIIPLKHFLFDKSINFKQFLFYPILSYVSILILWFLMGTMGSNSQLGIGKDHYGLYSANLLSFIDSDGFSRFLPDLPQYAIEQYEGFSYLGLGLIILIAFVFIYFTITVLITKRYCIDFKTFIPLVLLLLAYYLFAVSNKITFGSSQLMEIPVPEIVKTIGGIFRAIGRFVWPLYYFLIIFVIVFLVKATSKPKFSLLILLGIIGIQLYDIQLFFKSNIPKNQTYKSRLNSGEWTKIVGQFKEIVVFPPFENHLLNPMDYQDLCYLAVQKNLPITTGYVARENVLLDKKFCDSLQFQIEDEIIDPNKLYVTNLKNSTAFKSAISDGIAQIRELDNYILIVNSAKKIEPQLPQPSKHIDSLIDTFKKSETIQHSSKMAFNDGITYFIESLTTTDKNIHIQGWAFDAQTSNNQADSLFITLNDDHSTYIKRVSSMQRNDITRTFNKENLDNSGFKITVNGSKIPKGIYQIGILIKPQKGKLLHTDTGKIYNSKELKVFHPIFITDKNWVECSILNNVEEILEDKDCFKISGWATVENENSTDKSIQIILQKDAHYTGFKTNLIIRKDVTAYFKTNYNYDKSGFFVKIDKKTIVEGSYKIGILITDSKMGKRCFHITEKSILVNPDK